MNNDKKYVVPNLMGRLGNNMFMIANAYARSKDLNKELLIARNQVKYQGNDYSKNIFRKFNFIDKFEKKPEYIIYRGYFISEKYFSEYKDDILRLFSPPIIFVERIKKEIPDIMINKTTVINVRRGKDYLRLPNYHPVISIDYINKALSLINDSGFYLIASDDIKWCKENINVKPRVFLENYKPEEQLWILSLCHNFIISNSTFSWWAAYLSNNKGVIIAPETWFGPQRGSKSWSDIYCKEWTLLPTYFKSGLIYPK